MEPYLFLSLGIISHPFYTKLIPASKTQLGFLLPYITVLSTLSYAFALDINIQQKVTLHKWW